MRTGSVLALITLVTRFGLAAFDDLIAMTVRTKHGNEYHDALLLKQSAAWHTKGESANLQHDPRPYTEVMEELRKRQEQLLGLGDTPDVDADDDGDAPDEPPPPGSFTLD
jgi:hypothetical protein